MKTHSIPTASRWANFFLAALVLISFAGLTSCSSPMKFANSQIVPAAEGKVSIMKNKNDNYNVKLTVNNLAEPERLTPPKQGYVVWFESGTGKITNVGRLKITSPMFSKSLRASFSTTAVEKPVKVFITAENLDVANYPSYPAILTTQ